MMRINEYGVVECDHSNLRLTCRPDVNGNRRWQRQCMSCGAPIGSWISREAANREIPLDKIPLFDPSIAGRIEDRIKEMRSSRNEEWWSWYTEYLQSPEWRAKALAVHRRANSICEGCGAQPSKQVHHLSYANAGAEFLWELVAICDDCHDRAHDKERRAT